MWRIKFHVCLFDIKQFKYNPLRQVDFQWGTLSTSSLWLQVSFEASINLHSILFIHLRCFRPLELSRQNWHWPSQGSASWTSDELSAPLFCPVSFISLFRWVDVRITVPQGVERKTFVHFECKEKRKWKRSMWVNNGRGFWGCIWCEALQRRVGGIKADQS